jgi:hypothetical protein
MVTDRTLTRFSPTLQSTCILLCASCIVCAKFMPPDDTISNPTKLETTTRSEIFFFQPFVRHPSRSSNRQLEDNRAYAPATCMIDLLFSGSDKRLVTCRNSASDDSAQSRHDEYPQTDSAMQRACVHAQEDNHAFSWISVSYGSDYSPMNVIDSHATQNLLRVQFNVQFC